MTARLPVEELAELTDRDLKDDDVDTVGGLLAKHLGRVPIPGAQADVAGLRLVAESAEGRRNRIATVLVTPTDGSVAVRRRRNGLIEPAARRQNITSMPESPELDPEDAKIVTLARAARARSDRYEGAAVRDSDGRTYVGTTVTLASLELSALQVAVAMAVSSEAPGLEAAAVVGTADRLMSGDLAVLRELGGPDLPVLLAGPDGAVREVTRPG